jgi:hypothetical protein
MSGVVISVVAHVKRREMACKLAKTVQAQETCFDDGFLGEWKNHVRAWKNAWHYATETGCSHICVLQDDAMPVEQFLDHLQVAVETKPEAIISLYTGTHRPRKSQVTEAAKQADELGASWLVADTLMWGVGVVLPVGWVPDMLEFGRKSKLPYDQRVGAWAENRGYPVFYTWPSLVDHADIETVAHKGKQGVRVAHKTGVPNWSKVEVQIEKPPEGNMMRSNRDA